MTNGANQKLLAKAIKTNETALARKNLSITDRSTLETQSVMLAFISEYQTDHEKVEKMWIAYRIGLWALGIIGGANILYLFNRLAELITHGGSGS